MKEQFLGFRHYNRKIRGTGYPNQYERVFQMRHAITRPIPKPPGLCNFFKFTEYETVWSEWQDIPEAYEEGYRP